MPHLLSAIRTGPIGYPEMYMGPNFVTQPTIQQTQPNPIQEFFDGHDDSDPTRPKWPDLGQYFCI